ncbi:UGSC family (seleno)protein [Thermodesulfobacteriota bacterium]
MELASTTAYKKGIPKLRIVYTPHPITDQPADMCRKFLEGNDPHTGKPMLDEIISAITQPLSKEEKKRGFLKRDPRPKFLPPDTADNLQQYFMDNNFTDGGPVVLPTRERVARMLEGTSHDPEEIVGTMRPSPPHEAWEYNVEMVAVNAVMAGAKPEYFPVILALASTGTSSLFSSTSSFARMVLINGPIAKEIGMNPGIGAMGPFNQANATIGRAWTLISKNLGGSGKPGETYLGTLGNPLSYNNMCFPENEEELPKGWTPFHVQKGFKESDSVVSIFNGWSYNNIAWYSNLRNQDVMKHWLSNFFSFGTSQAIFMIDPVTADYIHDDGFDSKEKLADYLAKNSTTPAWLYWQRRERQMEMGKNGVEPYASYLKLGPDANIPESRFIRMPVRKQDTRTESGRAFLRDTIDTDNSLEIIVVGGSTNTYWGGGDFSYMSSALVDKWR